MDLQLQGEAVEIWFYGFTGENARSAKNTEKLTDPN